MKITPQSHVLAFDVDDTLAPSGQPLSTDMCALLRHLANQGYQLMFITSRSYSELVERIPLDLLEEAHAFTCMGMEHWHEDKMLYQHTFNPPLGLNETLKAIVESCDCPHKTGKHIIPRPSITSLTPLGVGASKRQREEFVAWNTQTGFLAKSAKYLQEQFPTLQVEVFGKTSIDISDKKMSKVVALESIRQFEQRSIIFFGDSMHQGGNDYALAEALKAESKDNVCHWVENPDSTYGILCAIRDTVE